jgi:glycosyltransferase involved in cell wall biosynthesis
MANRWKYSRAAAYLAVSAYAGHQLRQAGVPAGRIYLVPDAVPVPATMGSLDGPLVAIESEDPGKGTALLRQTGLPIVFTRELLSVLPSARALLYISDMEGLGSGALLSLAWGVPVIASRVGGLPEIVRHEETGLLVENHPAAIAQAASRLIEDRTLAERLGRNGRRMVEESFTLEAMAEKTLECYRQVLG